MYGTGEGEMMVRLSVEVQVEVTVRGWSNLSCSL